METPKSSLALKRNLFNETVIVDYGKTGSNWCKEKQDLIGTNNEDTYTLVDVHLYSTVTLACHYCNENDDNMPKVWYKKPRGFPGNVKEIETDFKNSQSNNRVFIMPDHTLVIRNLSEMDNGLYLCHGLLGEDSHFHYNFVIDVMSNGELIEIAEDSRNMGKSSLDILFKEIDEINFKFQTSNKRDYIRLRHEGVLMNVITIWSPWEPCNGCLKIKKRKRKCFIRPSFISKNTGVLPLDEIEVNSQMNVSEQQLEEKNSLFEYDFSCHSLLLAKDYPIISKDLERIPNYFITETCSGTCEKFERKEHKPKYENLFVIAQGGSATFICPESIYNSKVIWKKDGSIIEPLRKDHHLQVDMFATLYLRAVTYKQSGSYICFINQEPIQQINIVVKTNSIFQTEEFQNHLEYLGFIFIISFIIYLIGIISACTQKKRFKIINYGQRNKNYCKV